MAEFCLDCWNELNGTNDPKSKYIISKDLDFCEGCRKWKKVIVMERKYYFIRKFKVLYILWRILIFPYLLYKDAKAGFPILKYKGDSSSQKPNP